jgi:CubicO group peptidase (beta-lactamase class C family)
MSQEHLERVESAVTSGALSGVSFAYWDGLTLATATAGLRNSVTADPVTSDTVMHVGSIAKIFNTVLVLQLVDDGLITLEDPIVRYLPEFQLRNPEALQGITCGMLLNHTSGIDCDVPPDHGPDQERIVDAIARCREAGQLHAPGGGPSYCNMGMVIGGYLVQRMRGVSWYALMKSRIFEPLRMEHSVADLTNLPRFRSSLGNLTQPGTGGLTPTTHPFLPLSFAPAGTTLMMTATDLIEFARALLNGGRSSNGGRILSTTLTERMTQPTVPMLSPTGWQWGLGWMVLPGGILYHSGGGPGVAALLYADPGSGRALAVLSNCDRLDVVKRMIAEPILESWGKPAESPAQRLNTPLDPRPYVGTYDSSLYSVEVLAHEGLLALRTTPKVRVYDTFDTRPRVNPTVRLFPLGNHTFEDEGTSNARPQQYRFEQADRQGHMMVLGSAARIWVRTEQVIARC